MAESSEQTLCSTDGLTRLRERLGKIGKLRGWHIGDCHARQLERDCVIYDAFDREGRAHWLLAGPWREWPRVSGLWGHLCWASEIIASSSHIFRFMDHMVPEIVWEGVEEGYIGYSEKRKASSFFQAISGAKPPRFENLVQLTGFLRLLQTGENCFKRKESRLMMAEMEPSAVELVEALAGRIPKKSVFRHWKSFYLQNARSISRSASYRLTLSLGSYATTCFNCTDYGALLIDLPFFLSENIADMDLCQILLDLPDASVQDRQYLVDLYFNMDIPSHFFTLLTHHAMTSILHDFRWSPAGSTGESHNLDRFASLSRQHDLFRTPVPSWYL
ncbi:MAG: hypothetical protein GX838_04235 [Clostridiaceae bacterium]|nr:hypothetical protein [Clostridiaceae bacterium]